jgi:hypothetical protein
MPEIRAFTAQEIMEKLHLIPTIRKRTRQYTAVAVERSVFVHRRSEGNEGAVKLKAMWKNEP